MGAGASAQESSKLVLDKDIASRNKQGQKLGAEYEVTLLRPQMQGVKVNHKYVLRVAYEALVLTAADDAKTPLTYFKYQDIVCWGSSSHNFQFKVFGAAMGQAEPVAVGFKTALGVGKELEKVTLSSVLSLMTDMEKDAVSKDEFDALKKLIGGGKAEPAVEPAACLPPPGLPPPKETADDDAASAAATAAAAAEVASTSGGGVSRSRDDGDVMGAGAFFAMVKQVAASRLYTVHQGTAIMGLAKSDASGLDAFDRMDLAVFLWHTTLSPDSFQLILNTFDDLADRDNLIARLAASGKHRASASLLRPACPDAGGGVRVAQNGTRAAADSVGDYRIGRENDPHYLYLKHENIAVEYSASP